MLEGTHHLESTLYASQYNTWHDPDYCDYTHRIHFGSVGNSFIEDGDSYSYPKSIAANEVFINFSGDVISSRQQNHEEALGAYEATESKAQEDDHYEALADAAVSGAVGVATTAALSNPASGILASMAFSYLTSYTEDENKHQYEPFWNWDTGHGDIGEGVSDSATFARADVTTRTDESADVAASSTVTQLNSSSAFASTNFTAEGPGTCENPDSLSHESLAQDGLLKIENSELTTQQHNLLLDERPREILREKGALVVKMDTVVGSKILELRKRRAE
ncbi:hypothetical protein [Halorussus litoreus]|uniref:hypothetical protein n=1 Tax=Halorussus litoreus TaxID=1710536 RepID=UPI0018E59635|nr:hypothetical protein [Halorussus litoreus]